MSYKVLDAKWWTPPVPVITISDGVINLSIGAVAIESFEDGSWKVYMGYGRGIDEDQDKQLIAGHGMPIGSKDAACGLFPQFDREKFRY